MSEHPRGCHIEIVAYHFQLLHDHDADAVASETAADVVLRVLEGVATARRGTPIR